MRPPKRGWMRVRFKAHRVCRVLRVFLVRLVLLVLRGRRVYPALTQPFLVLLVQRVRLGLPAQQRCLLTLITHLFWALTG